MEIVFKGGFFMIRSSISIDSYDLLGQNGSEGIRYTWKHTEKKQLIESAAFINHRKNIEDNICGYTTSVSMGCILRAFGLQCSFCRTGNLLNYRDSLSAYDIAKQNIFMVLSDIYCSKHKKINNMHREFAYMGQGEPGYSYPQIRQAIKITNITLKELGQNVHRHIISTAGVPEMILSLKDDIKNNFYNEKVTLHFSLHAVSNREYLMPIEKKYPCLDVIECMQDFVDICGEKPCIGILLFDDFQPNGRNFNYTNELKEVKEILSYINPKKFRLSFCEFNDSIDVCKSSKYNYEKAIEILNYAKNSGYEAKLFSSFGKKEQTACGMLAGKTAEFTASNKFISIEQETEQLLKRSIRYLEAL